MMMLVLVVAGLLMKLPFTFTIYPIGMLRIKPITEIFASFTKLISHYTYHQTMV